MVAEIGLKVIGKTLALNISIFDGCRNLKKAFSKAKLSQKFKKVVSWSDQGLVSELETDNQNLRMVPGRFSPTSGLFRAMGYLDGKLLRFQRLI